MCELYYYDERTDEFKVLGELTDAEFIEVAEEVSAEGELRVFEGLDHFEGTIDLTTAEIDLRFRLLFKSWAGIVPRKIGVWA